VYNKGTEKEVGLEWQAGSICSQLLLDLFQSKGIKRWQPTPEKPAAKTSQVTWIRAHSTVHSPTSW